MCGSAAKRPGALLDLKATRLLLQNLKSAEAALDDERELSVQEQHDVARRLRVAETQDEVAKQRLAGVLASLHEQHQELHATSICSSTEGADLQRENARLRCQVARLQDVVQGCAGDVRKAAQEAKLASVEERQAFAAQAKMEEALFAHDHERQVAETEQHRLNHSLQEHEWREEAQLRGFQAEIETLRIKHEWMSLDLAAVNSQRANWQCEAIEWKAALDVERSSWTANHREFRLQEQHHHQNERSVAATLSASEASIRSLSSEVAELQARQVAEKAAVCRLEGELAGCAQRGREEQAASVQRARRTCKERCGELRMELQHELNDVKSSAVSAETALASDCAQFEGVQQECVLELAALREAEIAMMLRAEAREHEFVSELRGDRQACEDLQACTAARVAALQRAVQEIKDEMQGQLQMEFERFNHEACAWRQELNSEAWAAQEVSSYKVESLMTARVTAELRTELSHLCDELCSAHCDMQSGTQIVTEVQRGFGIGNADLQSRLENFEVALLVAARAEVASSQQQQQRHLEPSPLAIAISVRHDTGQQSGVTIPIAEPSSFTTAADHAQPPATDKTLSHTDWEALARAAWAGEQAARSELAATEAKHMQALGCMDELLNDSRELSETLKDHRRLTSGIEAMARENEERISQQSSLSGTCSQTLSASRASQSTLVENCSFPRDLTRDFESPASHHPCRQTAWSSGQNSGLLLALSPTPASSSTCRDDLSGLAHNGKEMSSSSFWDIWDQSEVSHSRRSLLKDSLSTLGNSAGESSNRHACSSTRDSSSHGALSLACPSSPLRHGRAWDRAKLLDGGRAWAPSWEAISPIDVRRMPREPSGLCSSMVGTATPTDCGRSRLTGSQA